MPVCTKCPLHLGATHVRVPSKGSKNPLIFFISEAPDPTEDLKNECFIGKAGQHLFDLLDRVGIDPCYCRFGNIVKCIPWRFDKSGFRPPADSEIDACIPYLEAEILSKDPVFVVPTGNTALHALIPKAPKISSARKKRFTLQLPSNKYIYRKTIRWCESNEFDIYSGDGSLTVPEVPTDKNIRTFIRQAERHGFTSPIQKEFTVYPIFHPSASLRGNEYATNAIIEDLSYLRTRVTGDRSVPFDKYEYLDTLDKIKDRFEMIKSLHRDGHVDAIGYDIETNCLNCFFRRNNPKMLLFSIAYGEGKAVSIPFDHCSSPFCGDGLAKKAILSMLEDLCINIPIVGHNLKFDLRWTAWLGCDIRRFKIAGDTYLASWTIWNDTIHDHSLETLATRHTGMVNHKEEMDNALKDAAMDLIDPAGNPIEATMDDIDVAIVSKYCSADTDATLRLHKKLNELMLKDELLEAHERVVVPTIVPVTLMEVRGARVDLDMLSHAKEEIEGRLDAVYDKINAWGYGDRLLEVINRKKTDAAFEKMRRPPKPLLAFQRLKEKQTLQLTIAAKSALLFDILNFTPVKYGKTGPSCDKETLGQLLESCTEHINSESDVGNYWTHRHDVVTALREFSADSKMYTSYIKPIPNHVDEDGIVHTSFGIRTTRTGRFNCRDISLHIFPWKSIAKCSICPVYVNGFIASVDYSQNELRVLASVTGDEGMIKVYEDGGDLHRFIASKVLHKPESEVLSAERRRVKTVAFGIAYGRGAASIASQERISKEEAQQLIDDFYAQFPTVAKWVKERHTEVKRTKQVWTPMGFRRIMDEHLDESEMNRRAVNTPIQSAGSDLGVLGLQNADKLLHAYKLKSHLFGFVHDSLLYSVAPGELWDVCMLARKGMQDKITKQVDWLKCPLRVDYEVGPSWGELTEAHLLPNRQLKFDNCKPKFHDIIEERFSSWDNPPKLLDKSVVKALEDGSEIFQSLSATASREAQYVELINSTWEFPKTR